VAILVYDADCGFCKSAVAKILRWDRHRVLRPLALQDEESDRLLASIEPEERMESWHLLDGGELFSGGPALVPLLRALPGGAPLASLAARVPDAALERSYRWVADHRGLFGRAVPHCSVRRAERLIAGRAAERRVEP
jgi:predicted DCC family thiol-disulfide oxidoreductase YuxK